MVFRLTNMMKIMLMLCICLTFAFGIHLEAPLRLVMAVNQAPSEADLALIHTYLDSIQDATTAFYGAYYTDIPRVVHFNVSVKRIYTESREDVEGKDVFIVFKSTPYIGPHDIVGTDELTFKAEFTGEVELVSFKHLANEPLPDYMKDLLKRPVPIG